MEANALNRKGTVGVLLSVCPRCRGTGVSGSARGVFTNSLTLCPECLGSGSVEVPSVSDGTPLDSVRAERAVVGWLVSNSEGDDEFINNEAALKGRHHNGGPPRALYDGGPWEV